MQNQSLKRQFTTLIQSNDLKLHNYLLEHKYYNKYRIPEPYSTADYYKQDCYWRKQFEDQNVHLLTWLNDNKFERPRISEIPAPRVWLDLCDNTTEKELSTMMFKQEKYNKWLWRTYLKKHVETLPYFFTHYSGEFASDWFFWLYKRLTGKSTAEITRVRTEIYNKHHRERTILKDYVIYDFETSYHYENEDLQDVVHGTNFSAIEGKDYNSEDEVMKRLTRYYEL